MLFFALVLVAGGAAVAAAGGKCVRRSPCVCEFPETGLLLDLKHLVDEDGEFLTAASDNATYYFHGCVDADFEVEKTNITQDFCTGSLLTFCVFDNMARSLTPLGNASTLLFGEDSKHPELTNIIFKDTVITLVCSPDLDAPELIALERNRLKLFSKHACKLTPSEDGALSTGSKLLIIAAVCFSIYLVTGALIARFIRGARGRELIPNLEFWLRLPALTNDGYHFLIGGCNIQRFTSYYNPI